MSYLQKLIVFVFTGLLIGFSTNAFSQNKEYIDIMILYSNEANSGIQNHATAAISSLNQSYSNSRINTEAFLVRAQNINYYESDHMQTNLNWLKTNSTVASLRNQYSADVVILMVSSSVASNPSADTVGLATETVVSGLDQNSAFAVVVKPFSHDDTYTFAHEIGHLVRGMHENESPSYFAKGYVYQGGADGQSKTIMARGSVDAQSSQLWSDPDTTITNNCPPGLPPRVCPPESVPGTSTNDMVRAWEDYSDDVSGYRSFYAPTNLTISTGSGYGEPYLDWDDHPATNFDHYKIFRKELYVSQFEEIATTTSSNYSDWTVSNKYNQSSEFQYAVKAVNTRDENSSYSNSVFYDGELMYYKEVSTTPTSFKLENNYPNPFNPTTTISFALPEQSEVRINVYNVNGQLVSSLINEVRPAGTFDIDFDASGLASGVYIARMVAVEERSGNRFSKNIKMQLVK